MRLAHFETLRPVCPACRKAGRGDHRLDLAVDGARQADTVPSGRLLCPQCRLEFPIIDGFPFLVPDPRSFIAQQLTYVLMRDTLPAEVESLVGDAAGPGSAFDSLRQHQSSYGWDHYGDLDPDEPDPSLPGSALRCLNAGLRALDQPLAGAALDAGCAAGRSSFALADAVDGLVLGIDLNLPLLRVAARVLREGIAAYPRRRIGLVYDRRTFPVSFAAAERVDFWVADALALPFAAGGFGGVAALNLLDCLSAPRDALIEFGHALSPSGRAILTTPYDWSSAATPPEAWIGGHSQRGPHAGAAEPLLRRLLSEEEGGRLGLRLVAEEADLPWHVRLHDRALMQYRVHLVVAGAARG